MKVSYAHQRGFWFRQDHRLDIERGTELGTLGFLPVEIRQQIWDYTIDHYQIGYTSTVHRLGQRTVDLSDNAFWSHDATPYAYPKARWMKKSTLWNIRHVSADVAFEFDRVLFSTYAAMCKRPPQLKMFLDRVQGLEDRYPGLRMPIRLEVSLLVETDWLVRYKGENAWSRSFQWLPTSLASVIFVLKDGDRDTTHEMWLLQCLNQRIACRAPEAVTAIRWLPQRFDCMAEEDRAAFESCVRNSGKPSGQ